MLLTSADECVSSVHVSSIDKQMPFLAGLLRPELSLHLSQCACMQANATPSLNSKLSWLRP